MLDFVMEKCKNCGENHFIYKTDFKCYQCNKRICKTCGTSRSYLSDQGKFCLECPTCYNEVNVKIRKMPTSENGNIREYNIVKEKASVDYSKYFSNPSSALEYFKHVALSYNFNGIIYLKTESFTVDRREIINLTDRKTKGYQLAYRVSGIFVVIEKQL